MDFKDSIKQLAGQIERNKDNLVTEEATKNACIMPFMVALGYNVFDPSEVLPEFVCDAGIKKGEKIDYAIMKDGEPVILIECKKCFTELEQHGNQLLRYFHVSKAKFGVLTNGIIYRFYTDLEKENVMDKKPFLEINILDLKDGQIEELQKFHKSYFDINNILTTASELKYTNELKRCINNEFSSPSTEFVTYFTKKVYDGRLYQSVYEQFEALLKSAMNQWKNELVNERLKAALSNAEQSIEIKHESGDSAPEPEDKKALIVTTEEELQGYYIVKSILFGKVDNMDRVTHRDTQSYFGILLDDNNRKPICRLHFNTAKKYLEVFNADKTSVKHQLNTLDDIYKYADAITAAAGMY